MTTLLDLIEMIRNLGLREAVCWSNGFRTWTWSYADLLSRIHNFGRWLDEKGIRRRDRMLIWGENRPEWIAAFWGAVSRGVEVVPVDFRFSSDLARRIQRESAAKLVVHGSSVDSRALEIERIALDAINGLPSGSPTVQGTIGSDDVVEIVYTSGTTGEPKGVVHRHRNICANLEPIQAEIDKYKKWATPFQPIRILDLLPLSHMFGQSMGLFIPLLLGGAAAFTEETLPSRIVAYVSDRRVSVIVSVPRMLETLQNHIRNSYLIPPPPSMRGVAGVAFRWWRYRRIHSAFGWKFWAFVVGGAKLDTKLEEFWSSLGYAVIQGYGLTEASPVVAVNHPFDTERGSLGKVVPGQEVMVAPDGEILVRGESVTGERGSWLHTGDLGEIDTNGRLYYRGRKKDVIVTPEGLNVHPEDVEAVLNSIDGVRDSAVVGTRDQVHAALILSTDVADAASIVRAANEKLEAHQRIRDWTIWPDDDFPRTPSTMKVQRYEVARRIEGTSARIPTAEEKSPLDLLLDRQSDARLDADLGLSSLDRVELMSEIESRYGIDVNEEDFSRLRTVNDLRHEVQRAPERSDRRVRFQTPSDWPQFSTVRAFRYIAQNVLVLPLFRHYIPLTVYGLENLDSVSPPVIFAANHTSHLDTIVIIAGLPPKWRRLVTPAMSKDYFRAWFEQGSWTTGLQYLLARSLFNTYPLPQELPGVRGSLEYTGALVDRGYCPLVFPEGIRTPDGTLQPFRPGIGLMAVRLRVPVIPVRIEGLFAVYSIHHNWPKPGPIRMTLGSPLSFDAKTLFESAARAIEQAVINAHR